jgi:signal transduction histidine kinase
VYQSLRRWYRDLSLRAKFTFHITAPTVVLFGVLVPSVVYLTEDAVLEEARQRGLQLTKVFAHASVQALVDDDFLVVRQVINSVGSEPDVLYAMIVEPSGRILAHSDIRQTGQIVSDPASGRALLAETPLRQEVQVPGPRVYDFAVPIYVLTERRAVARLGVSLERELAAIRKTRNLVVALGALALVAGCALAAWQARGVTRPLHDLVKGARDLAAGNLANRIRSRGGDEAGQLAEAFNRMAEALQSRIEDLRRAQEDAVRKTRLAAIGEIAAVVAHETRNPLGAISNCVQILAKHVQLSADNAELLDIIKGETSRLNAIVSDFLAYGRPRSPVLQNVDLHECIDEALALLRRDDRYGSTIDLVRKFEPTAPSVLADPAQLRQVFWNLFLNAVQAMGTTGTLVVETHSCRGEVEIVVTDTGPGIPPDVLPRLFEPFQGNRAGGMGLGLATVRRIVEDHGGRVAAHTAVRGGARFVISLPA